jgi:predicted regulator of Ras-like GTPase activity (Roadblock/LC7/MglB family)
MPTLRELTEAIQSRPGVEAVVIVGADGLLIETHDTAQSHAEAIAARVPGVATAAALLGDAAQRGTAALAVIEFDRGYGVILRLSDEAMIFVSAAASVALGDLLFDLRQHRSSMAALV